jgi:hypothetical protein
MTIWKLKSTCAFMVVVISAMTIGHTRDLVACGEKFLVPGRGIQFQRTPKQRQASTLLIYAPPSSGLSTTLTKLKVEASMTKAGYRPVVVTTAEALGTAAAKASWEIVVADVADSAEVKRRIGAAESVHLVAVAPKGTAIQMAAARTEFPRLITAPSRAQDFLDAIDGAGACARADRAKNVGRSH